MLNPQNAHLLGIDELSSTSLAELFCTENILQNILWNILQLNLIPVFPPSVVGDLPSA